MCGSPVEKLKVILSHISITSLPLKHHIAELPGSYALHRFIRYSCIYEAHVSPALNRNSAIRRFKHSNAIEKHDGITFDFYTGLPHVFLGLTYLYVIYSVYQ